LFIGEQGFDQINPKNRWNVITFHICIFGCLIKSKRNINGVTFNAADSPLDLAESQMPSES